MNIRIVIVFSAVLVLSACMQSEYERMVRRELASGIRQDSIFLGVYLGMSSKAFYAQCWELNKRGIIKEGSGNTSVEYKLTEMDKPARLNFYPKFYEDKIWQMDAFVSYNAWSPWNKAYERDSLEPEVLKLLEKWYGSGFITVTHPEKGRAFVKVTGNRRVSILPGIETDKVRIEITDLSMLKKATEAEPKR